MGHFVEIPDRFENHSLRSERSAMAGEVTAPGEIFGAVTDAFRNFGAVTAPLAIDFAVTAPGEISPFLTRGGSVLDAGSVADSWRQATGTPVWGTPDGPYSNENGQPAGEDAIRAALATATR